MKKTIVLLLSAAVILGCMAVPVAAYGVNVRSATKVYEFHGISMEKAKLTFDFVREAHVTLGLKKTSTGQLYGVKSSRFVCASSLHNVFAYSDLVASSVGCDGVYYNAY